MTMSDLISINSFSDDTDRSSLHTLCVVMRDLNGNFIINSRVPNMN